MTCPLIGNYGLNDEDAESRRPWVNGFVVREASRVVSSWRGRVSLDEYMVRHRVVGIEGIHTWALSRLLCDRRAQGGLVSTAHVGPARLAVRARRLPPL